MEIRSSPQGSNSDHLANERTFLAWIRTSLGLMAFGFVVVKFALFLKQFAFVLQGSASATQPGHSFVIGISLVGFGVLMGVLAFFKYLTTKRQLDGKRYRNSPLLPVLLTAAVFLIGILLVVYLVQSTR